MGTLKFLWLIDWLIDLGIVWNRRVRSNICNCWPSVPMSGFHTIAHAVLIARTRNACEVCRKCCCYCYCCCCYQHLAIMAKYYYAALLHRRGPHIASHSVCLSVCPSVPWLLTLEHRSRVFVNLADVRYLFFCLHVRAAYSTAISAARACYISLSLFTMAQISRLFHNTILSHSTLLHSPTSISDTQPLLVLVSCSLLFCFDIARIDKMLSIHQFGLTFAWWTYFAFWIPPLGLRRRGRP